MRQATLQIEGMSCEHCVNSVNRALSAMPGVRIDSLRIGRAEVTFYENSTGPTQLEAAIADAGYRATVQR
jgi:copper chaperone CopZ